MAPKLYCMDFCPASRSVYLTATALGIELEYVQVDVLKKEHLTPEFAKLNPLHTIPVLDDGGKIIRDSHAIIPYLADKYGKNDSLYPKDHYRRAIINQKLHFDSGSVAMLLPPVLEPMITKGVKSLPPHLEKEANLAYEFLNRFLKLNKYLAGDTVTIADYSVIPTVTSLDCIVPIDKSKYDKVVAWIQEAQKWPTYKLNQKGLNDFKEFVQKYL